MKRRVVSQAGYIGQNSYLFFVQWSKAALVVVGHSQIQGHRVSGEASSFDTKTSAWAKQVFVASEFAE